VRCVVSFDGPEACNTHTHHRRRTKIPQIISMVISMTIVHIAPQECHGFVLLPAFCCRLPHGANDATDQGNRHRDLRTVVRWRSWLCVSQPCSPSLLLLLQHAVDKLWPHAQRSGHVVPCCCSPWSAGCWAQDRSSQEHIEWRSILCAPQRRTVGAPRSAQGAPQCDCRA